MTEDLVDRDNGRRCGDGGDAEFGLEKTCMSSAEFDSHLAGHRNGKAFLNGLLIAFGPFMMGMPEKTFLNLKWTPDSPIASMTMLMKTHVCPIFRIPRCGMRVLAHTDFSSV